MFKAPPLTVTPLEFENTPTPAKLKVPLLMVIAPVLVFELEMVTCPVPFIVRLPDPLMVELRVKLLLELIMRAPLLAKPPDKLETVPASSKVPVEEVGAVMARLVPLRRRVPAEMVVPPL